MLCDKCKSREASVHVTQIINGVQYEQNLCGECAGMAAGMLGNMMNMNGMDMLRKWFSGNMASVPALGQVGVTPWQEEGAPQGGEQTFEALGLTLPKTVQAPPEESGAPVKEKPARDAAQEKARLEAELKEAIEREEYEKAAQLRDKIKALKD